MKKRYFAVLLLMLILLPLTNSLFAQETIAGAESAGAPSAEDAMDGPPLWARNLRRAEIIATGSYPLTLLAARLVYSLLRFTIKSIEAGAIDASYAPWFLAPPGSPELLFSEKLGIVVGAAGLSSLIAFVDYRRGVSESESAP